MFKLRFEPITFPTTSECTNLTPQSLEGLKYIHAIFDKILTKLKIQYKICYINMVVKDNMSALMFIDDIPQSCGVQKMHLIKQGRPITMYLTKKNFVFFSEYVLNFAFLL